MTVPDIMISVQLSDWKSKDAEIERLRAQNERLALDALGALSNYTATAVEGYTAAPHMLASDIHRLGRERDRLAEALKDLADSIEVWDQTPAYEKPHIGSLLEMVTRARAALEGK